MADNQAIVIPETIDAIRALTRAFEDASDSIAMTHAALGSAPTLVDAPPKVARTEAWSAR